MIVNKSVNLRSVAKLKSPSSEDKIKHFYIILVYQNHTLEPQRTCNYIEPNIIIDVLKY